MVTDGVSWCDYCMQRTFPPIWLLCLWKANTVIQEQCYVNKASGHSRNQFTSWILNALLKLESRTAVTAQVCCTGRRIRKLKRCLIKGCMLTNGHSLASSNRSGTSLASLSRATSAIGPKITTGLRNPAKMRQKKKKTSLFKFKQNTEILLFSDYWMTNIKILLCLNKLWKVIEKVI